MNRTQVAGLMLLGTLLGPSVEALASQTLTGRVVDSLSQEPLPYAVVEVVLRPGDPRHAITDAQGVFTIQLPHHYRGHVVVGIRRIGYQRANRELSTGKIGVDTLHTIALQRMPTELASVTVTVARIQRLQRAGFYDRASSGFGHFIPEEKIVDRQPRHTSDILHGVPGISISPSRRGAGSFDIIITRARTRLRGPCRPRFIVDGKTVATSSDATFDLDAYVTPEEIAGIEIYRGPAETPAAFGGPESACGVIVIWTK